MSHSFIVQPQTPRRQMRHRTSLEHVLTFSFLSPLPTTEEIAEATLLYHLILDGCEEEGVVLQKTSGDGDEVESQHDVDRVAALAELRALEGISDTTEPEPADGPIPLHKLFRCIYEYLPKAEGRVNVVRLILHGLFPPEDRDDSDSEQRSLRCILIRARIWLDFGPSQKEAVYRTLALFATDFLEGFFVPFKAQGRCTPGVSTLITPTSRTEPGPDQGTPSRLGNLRSLCLARDGNRCVVTRRIDSTYLQNLYERSGQLPPPTVIAAKTEAAHIIPHSLNALSGESTTLHPSKCTVWRILNMFDPGISRLLAGPLIDSPANAMMLIPELHDRFGRLQCYLQEVPDVPYSYTFHSTRGAVALHPTDDPAGRHIVFANHERDLTVPVAQLPNPRFLRIHRACCMILSMSGAAGYVEKLVRDTETLMQRGVLATDGSSNFALLMRLRGLEQLTSPDPWDIGFRLAVEAN